MALSKWANRKDWGNRQADMKRDAPCRIPWGKAAPSKPPPLSVRVNAAKTEEAWGACGFFFFFFFFPRQNKRSLWKRYHPVWGTALLERVAFASAWISGWYILFLFHTCTHSQFRDTQFVFWKFEAKRSRGRLDLRRGIRRKLHHVKNTPTVTGIELKGFL